MGDDFRTTSWGLVLTVQDPNTERAARALAALCEAYWPPLYAFARRRGHDTEEARDLTQAFFTHLLENRGLEKLRPGAGRFRSFLLTSFKNLLTDERIKAEALKRGAGKHPISLDFDSAESGSSIEATDELTPELLFEKRWAMTVLQRVMERLRAEFVRDGEDNYGTSVSHRQLSNGVPNPLYLQPIGNTVAPARTVQLGLRYSF